MAGIDELRRYWSWLVRWMQRESPREAGEQTDASDVGEVATSREWQPGTEVDPVGFDPDDLDDRTAVFTEVGLLADEFLLRLLEDQGGRLPQQAFTEYTSWSEGLLSRVLKEMEDESLIVRVQIGRGKIVCLPDHVPASDLGSPDDTDDPRAA